MHPVITSKTLYDSELSRKVRFLAGPLEKGGVPLRESLAEVFDAPMVEWLMAEVRGMKQQN